MSDGTHIDDHLQLPEQWVFCRNELPNGVLLVTLLAAQWLHEEEGGEGVEYKEAARLTIASSSYNTALNIISTHTYILELWVNG